MKTLFTIATSVILSLAVSIYKHNKDNELEKTEYNDEFEKLTDIIWNKWYYNHFVPRKEI